MIDFYNAFVSYKHGPLDSKIADHIQDSLERFHVPGKIRKKTGKKRIDRVFLDKDELNTTSNLSDTIQNALEHSEYLIVICSPETRKSEWVQREIDYFLTHHSRDKILTVLTEGEPFEVIPESLLYEKKEVTDVNGNVHKISVPLEPLSCDYRMPIRQADKEELPRLASAILGCSYDELMNRRRQYQMQRIGILGCILAVLAIGFSGYMYSSARKIERNYQESLRNQSRYLATESQRLLNNEQRIEAIQVALAALPSKSDSRPVTAEATKALSDAVLAYQTQQGVEFQSCWNYQMPAKIEAFTFSPDEKLLACRDVFNNVYVWEIESHELLFTKTVLDGVIYYFRFLDDSNLAIITNSKCSSYNIFSGKEKWSISDTFNFWMNSMIIPIENGTSVLLLKSDLNLLKLNSKTGEIQNTYDLRNLIDTSSILTIYSVVPSSDASRIAMYIKADDPLLVVYSLVDGSYSYIKLDHSVVTDICWCGDDRLFCALTEYSIGVKLEGNMQLIEEKTSWLSVVDPDTMEIKWTNEMTYFDYRTESGALYFPGHNKVAFYCGACSNIYSVDDGQILETFSVSQPLIDISDRDGDGDPIFITQDGCMASATVFHNEEVVALSRYFADDIEAAQVCNGVYVLRKQASDIIFYDLGVYDEDWQEIDEDVSLSSYPVDTYLDDEYMALSTYKDGVIYIYAWDIQDDSFIGSIEIDPEYIGYDNRILGVYDDVLYVAYLGFDNEMNLIMYDLCDGGYEVEKYESQATEIEMLGDICDNTMVFLYHIQDEGSYIGVMNLDTQKIKKIDIPVKYPYACYKPVYLPSSGLIYYADREGDYLINVSKGKSRAVFLPDDWGETSMVCTDAKQQRLIVSNRRQIAILDLDGNLISSMPCNGNDPLGAMIFTQNKKEIMLVVYADGILSRYDIESGNYLGSSVIHVGESSGNATFFLDEKAGTLYIHCASYLDMIDLDSWIEIANVRNAIGYQITSDRFFACSYMYTSDVRVGYFQHYTLQELIDKANEILSGAELSEERKAQYGIG